MNKTAVIGGVVVIAVILALGLGLGFGLSGGNEDKTPAEDNESGIFVNIPGQGRVRGTLSSTTWTNESFMMFLSIPFAESPTGDLRFRAPVKRSPWQHIHDGTKFGRGCPTMFDSSKYLPVSQPHPEEENCLTISVHTKSLNSSSPVIVHIHGGGFVFGDATIYHADYLLSEDVVLVVFQYRLGPLGFLSMNTPDLPGNMAIADSIMALEWVQNNIHYFGGNKNLVTVFGQSAGSWMASVLLLSPQTENKNLFQRVILNSGIILSKWRLDADPIEQAHRYCGHLNCNDCEDSTAIYECVKSKSALELRKGNVDEKFEPKIENQLGIMPQHSSILLENYNRSIPILIGFQRHDGSLPLDEFYPEMKTKWGSYDNKTVRQFTQELLTRVTDYSGVTNDVLLRLMFDKTPGVLDSTDHHRALPAYFDIASMIFLKSAINTFARRMEAKKTANVFLYTFDHIKYTTNDMRYPWKNIAPHDHFTDFIFLKRQALSDELDIKMAQQMVSLYTSFASTGIPKNKNNLELMPMTRPTGPFYHFKLNVTQGYDVLKELTTNIDDTYSHEIIDYDVPF